MNKTVNKLTPKDYSTNQEIRWCPGCGDFAILKAVEKTLANVGADRDKTVFVSGIGCSSRFPYYLDTYGFHTIHGRAPAFATGIALARPELDIWIATGDGDALSIGGNHLMHILRRNINCVILLFNNHIYGLTKGQYSPTSDIGQKSPSSPYGASDNPISPLSFALGSGAKFVARTIDTQQAQLIDILTKAYEHNGTSFVEILQNCIVYNDGVFNEVSDKKLAKENQISVEDGKACYFGADSDKALYFDEGDFKIKAQVTSDISEDKIFIHDTKNLNKAKLISEMRRPDMPVATGIIYENQGQVYEDEVYKNIQRVKQNRSSIDDVLKSGLTWEVK